MTLRLGQHHDPSRPTPTLRVSKERPICCAQSLSATEMRHTFMVKPIRQTGAGIIVGLLNLAVHAPTLSWKPSTRIITRRGC